MLKTLLEQSLTPINQAVEKLLSCDPKYPKSIMPLEGSVLSLHISPLPEPIYLHVQSYKLQLSLSPELREQANVVLSGKLTDFVETAFSNDNARLVGTLRYEGNIQTGQAFQAFFSQLTIDWEEQLSKLTGDVLARQTVLAVKNASKYLQQLLATTRQNSSEWLTEESRLSPPSLEMENFFDDIDDLRNDTDRLEAALTRLERHIP
ncbi:MAG: SCP2 sterol-binding domain-containing protein [Pseudomonadota bacterium]